MASKDQLEAQLYEAFMAAFRETSEKYWPPNRFLQTLHQEGALITANRYSADPQPSEGFSKLWELNRLDLSIEAISLRGPWIELLESEARIGAKRKLTAVGYPYSEYAYKEEKRKGNPDPIRFSLHEIEKEIVLSRDDVLLAIERIDAGIDHPFSEATGYELRYEEKTYWPKAVFGVSISLVLKRQIFPRHFKGGEGSKCFSVLRELGFSIQEKSAGERGSSWTEREIRLIVDSYFEMWRKEQFGQAFNKAKYRRNLSAAGLNRSEASIELKHQNISAILQQTGLPFIIGYKPADHYQNILEDIVVEHISLHARQLTESLDQAEVRPLDIDPDKIDFSTFAVEPPNPTFAPRLARRRDGPYKIDFASREKRNRKLGSLGEQMVVQYEKWRLINAGKSMLAAKVRWVSEVDDGLGYDIQSFDEQGSEIYIEVKTTTCGKESPFLISANEIETSVDLGSKFRIYRVFGVPTAPKVFIVQGPIGDLFELTPRLFEARLK